MQPRIIHFAVHITCSVIYILYLLIYMNIAKGFDNEVMHVGILYLKLAASKTLCLHLSAYILCAHTKTHM